MIGEIVHVAIGQQAEQFVDRRDPPPAKAVRRCFIQLVHIALSTFKIHRETAGLPFPDQAGRLVAHHVTLDCQTVADRFQRPKQGIDRKQLPGPGTADIGRFGTQCCGPGPVLAQCA